jgi:hypothetical protein
MARSKMFNWICFIGVTSLVACVGRQGIAAGSDAGVAEIDFWKQDIVITAEATTHRDVTSERIKSLPVTNVAEILKTQVGVTVRNDQFYICSRSSEVPYTVKGAAMKDPLGSCGPVEVPAESEGDLTSTDLSNLIENLYGDTGGFFRELKSEAVPHFDVDDNGEVDLIDFVQAVDETILMQTD